MMNKMMYSCALSLYIYIYKMHACQAHTYIGGGGRRGEERREEE